MKILLVNPSLKYKINVTTSWDIRSDKQGIYPPLGLLYIATYLKSKTNHDINIIDMVAEKLNYHDLEKCIKEIKPDIVGVTSCTENFVSSLEVLNTAKTISTKIKTIIGGPHCIMFPHETLRHKSIDYMMRGEGELAFTKFISNINKPKILSKIKGLWFKTNGKVIDNGITDYIKNLDALPIPDRTLLKSDNYYCILGSKRNVLTLLSSRGCPHNCIYCDLKLKKFRLRSVVNILKEIKLYTDKGFNEFFFFDDMFNITINRLKDISQGILHLDKKIKWTFRGRVDNIDEESMRLAKQSGCERIQFGIESSTDEKLAFLKKNITTEQIKKAVSMAKKYDIITVGNFILGLPIEKNIADIEQTIRFSISLNLDYVQYHLLKIWPGTELFTLAEKKNLAGMAEWQNYVRNADFNFSPGMWTEHFTKDELKNIIKKAFKKFYFRPKYIFKNIWKTRSIYEIKRKITGLKELLKK